MSNAIIDLAPGCFHGTTVEGVVIVLRREAPIRKFVGVLRDPETSEPMASAFMAGASQKSGPSWTWLENTDPSTFADIEGLRLLQRLKPRGRHTSVTLRSLLPADRIEKADKPIAADQGGESFLFVPEYAGSLVTAELDEQTVKPKAVYRLAIDPSKANARFLARLLNSPYGKQLRIYAASGATIRRFVDGGSPLLGTSGPGPSDSGPCHPGRRRSRIAGSRFPRHAPDIGP